MDVLFVQPSVAYVVTCVYHMVVVFCALLVSTVPRENLVKNPHFTPKRSGGAEDFSDLEFGFEFEHFKELELLISHGEL